MAPIIERVLENIELGEGPHWDIETQSLYFVDIFSNTINRYVPATKRHTKAHFEDLYLERKDEFLTVCSDSTFSDTKRAGAKDSVVEKPLQDMKNYKAINDIQLPDTYVTFIVPVEGEKNKFVVGLGRHIVFLDWDGESDKVEEVKVLAEVDHHSPESMENRLNDGKCDPTGRLWAGTMGVEKINGHVKPNMGSFYSYSNRKLKKHFSEIGISNGLTWSRDNSKLFFIDSMKGVIDQFDFDPSKGELSNKNTLFTFEKNQINGLPDGMTIDEDENLWVACFNGYQVIKIDSRKPETLLDTIKLPAKQVTSVAWGGPNLDELYVTSAKFLVDGVVLNPPDHGSVYKISGLGTKGLPMSKFKF